jgi:hypothetical protein
MVKRILFGFLWCVGFYFAGCALVGAVAGAIAGAKDPANASQVGAMAGTSAVEALHVYIFAGAVLLSVVGSWAGLLPGTRIKKPVLEQP